MKKSIFKGFVFVLVLLVIVVMLNASGNLLKQKEVKKEKSVEAEKTVKPNTETESIVKEELSKENEELQKIKILKVGKYEIDTTKHKPNERIKLKYCKKEIKENGNKVNKIFYVYGTYSKNKEYALLAIGEGYSEAEYGDKFHLEIYKGQKEKKLLSKIQIKEDYFPSKFKFLKNGYLIFEIWEYTGTGYLEIYSPEGKKIFEYELNSNCYYDISPKDDYVILRDHDNNKLYIINLTLQKKIIYNLKEHYDFVFTEFSKNGELFIMQGIKGNNIKLCLFTKRGLLYEKDYTVKQLKMNNNKVYFKFSKKGTYIIYNKGIINLKTGKIIKKNLTTEELKKYEGE